MDEGQPFEGLDAALEKVLHGPLHNGRPGDRNVRLG
jgi:hypothetical protein